jgi:hypothetical protein
VPCHGESPVEAMFWCVWNWENTMLYPLVIADIAIENGHLYPFIGSFPIKQWVDFP